MGFQTLSRGRLSKATAIESEQIYHPVPSSQLLEVCNAREHETSQDRSYGTLRFKQYTRSASYVLATGLLAIAVV